MLQTIIDAVNTSELVLMEILEDSSSLDGVININGYAITVGQLASVIEVTEVNGALEEAYQLERGFSNPVTLEEIQTLINTVNRENEDDGVINSEDAFSKGPSESVDTDNDGVGANVDFDDNNPNIGVKPLLVIPEEAFTPNGDGINESWKIKGIEAYPNSDVRLYNRYGHIVFQKQDIIMIGKELQKDKIPSYHLVLIYILSL